MSNLASGPRAADLRYHDIAIDQVYEIERTFTQDDTLAFAAVSGDYSPLHVDSEYAATTPFGACVVHGLLLASLFSQLVGMRIPGRSALYLGQDLSFRRPVLVGETVRAIARVTGKSDATSTVVLATEIRGSDGKTAVTGTGRVKIRDTPAGIESGTATPAVKVLSTTGDRRVALIAGGSGGMGGAIARNLARRGVAVAVNFARNRERAKALVTDIISTGGIARMFEADITESTAADQLVLAVRNEMGAPTILINAAIREIVPRAASELTWSDFEAHFAYQVKAIFDLCKLVYPMMKAANGGCIVNLLSQVNAGVPPGRMADYTTAKHALEGLSKALAAEWAPDGIRVNMVSPGLTRTELTQFHQDRIFKMEEARTPLRRIATPEDVAAAVAFLCTDESSFITGANLFVTGGQVML